MLNLWPCEFICYIRIYGGIYGGYTQHVLHVYTHILLLFIHMRIAIICGWKIYVHIYMFIYARTKVEKIIVVICEWALQFMCIYFLQQSGFH